MKRLLILGANGQVGTALLARARRAGIGHVGLTRAQCDITDARAFMQAVAPGDVVVTCAAYTAVDGAEGEAERRRRVNALGARNVAAACAAAGAPLVHISTDYVFDGDSPRAAREGGSEFAPTTLSRAQQRRLQPAARMGQRSSRL
jgi:dTDP-4-dehydrorhamnose reductase